MTISKGLDGRCQHSRTRVSRRVALGAATLAVALASAALSAEPENASALLEIDTPLPAANPATTSDSCLLCHTLDPTLSHPVGIAPPASMAVPADLPLERGLVNCVTCHSAVPAEHASSPRRPLTAVATAHANASLCLRCHDATGSSTPEMHAAALGRAHLSGAQGGWAARNSAEGALRGSASESTTCLTCHDGAMASDATARTGAVLIGMPDEGPQSHPVGVEYRMTDLDARDGALRPESMLDPRVRLFDHRVECASCHSPYSPEPRLLVMSNEGSVLCLTCHDL